MTQTALTLGEAAKTAGKVKSTILRAIRSGAISATRNEAGEWQIEPVELLRVFPATVAETGGSNDAQRYENANETGALASEIKRLRELLSVANSERERERGQLEDQVRDLRDRLDREAEERRQLSARLLTGPERRRSLFGWFRRA